MPVWDLLIDALERAASPLRTGEADHRVSRPTFCRALGCAGVEMSRPALLRLLQWADPAFAGEIDWVEFLSNDRAPYFFDGRMFLHVRRFFRQSWKAMLARCKGLESGADGTMSSKDWQSNADAFLSVYEFADGSRAELASAISEVSLMFADPTDGKRVKYRSLLLHYAGELAGADELWSRKWELVWRDLGHRWDVVGAEELSKALCKPQVRCLYDF